MNDLISIVIPNYNNAEFVGSCIRSCIMGTYLPIEIIVYDDGSTDSSVEEVELMIQIHSGSEIKLIRSKKNLGIGHSRNEGIIASRGKYIVHIDSDDMLVPGGIDKRYEAIRHDKGIGYVHANAYKLTNHNGYFAACTQMIDGLIDIHKTEGDRPHAQTIMIRREMYKKYGLYDESLIGRVDREMLERISMFGNEKIVKINDVVAFYRRHRNSITSTRDNDKAINERVVSDYNNRIETLKRDGITKQNTRFI